MNKVPNCNKLRKGDPKFVIPFSYIVIVKQHYDMSEMVSCILTNSTYLDSYTYVDCRSLWSVDDNDVFFTEATQ